MNSRRIGDLPEYLMFVSDSQDVEAITDRLPWDERDEYGAFFVWAEDGDYTEIWGIEGTVPYIHKRAFRII